MATSGKEALVYVQATKAGVSDPRLAPLKIPQVSQIVNGDNKRLGKKRSLF